MNTQEIKLHKNRFILKFSVPSIIAMILTSLITVIVIEHNLDVMRQADWIIDVGPDGGSAGGQVVFTGTVAKMMESSKTITAQWLRRGM